MKKLIFAMFFAALLLLPVASAGTLALDITGGSVATDGNWSLGWQFTVTSPITVNGLAFYDNTDDESHLVGIYDNATQALLISTTVLTTDPDMGTAPWRVHSVTPYVLVVGTYDIMAVTGDDNYAWNPTTITTIPQITYVRSEYYSPAGGVLAFPNDTDGNQAYFGPSFTVGGSAVPEPASFLLIGGGLLLAAGLRRRR